MLDAIVVGAGLGGLMAAAKLAAKGRRVLVLEKKALPGGTAYVFRRGGYAFPMGPLAFSFPRRVHEFLDLAGADGRLAFRRSGFELRAPGLDILMSKSLADIRADLARNFPGEAAGLGEFFDRLGEAVAVSADMDRWHPDFAPSPSEAAGRRRRIAGLEGRIAAVRRLSDTPASAVLDGLLGDRMLRNFLGSLGTGPPEMSMLTLAAMWNVMSEEGIWFPLGGLHGIVDRLMGRIASAGGEVRLGEAVGRISISRGRAAGVVTASGRTLESRWVISNADAKATFLELLEPSALQEGLAARVSEAAYTGSELSVCLGLRPERVDLSALRTEHLFYRREVRGDGPADPEAFADREIEVCHWSGQAPELVPAGRESLVLRVGFPYAHFAGWRAGDRTRKPGYREYKARLAGSLVRTVEAVLPGLSDAVELMDVATPLTFRDWGGRTEGSVAGWSWSAADAARLPGGLMVRTPVPGLLAAGIYAATGLFWGGVPTALYTGSLAADRILAG